MNIKSFPENIYGHSGICEHGYTTQTVLLVRHLQRNPDAMRNLRRALDMLESDITYSNQDFDRRQAVASDLSDMIRKEANK